MSLSILAVLTATLLFEPTGAAPHRFLAPISTASSVLALEAQGQNSEFIAAKGSSAGGSKDGLSLQQLEPFMGTVGASLQRAEPSWLLKYQGPDGRTEVVNMRETQLTWMQVFKQSAFTWGFWLVLALLVYFSCYRGQSPHPEKKAGQVSTTIEADLQKMFTTGHWQCMTDSSICICSFLCPGLRWADNISIAGFLTFWVAFAAFQAITLLNIIGNGACFGVFTGFLLLYFRQQLREKLHVESWTFGSCIRDFCYVCWCPCCAIAQEARIVKEGVENGYEFS